jgi:hypothetical protein
MQPINQMPSIVPMPANDLPEAPATQHARLRSRERRLRGPIWAEPGHDTQVA